MVEVSLLLMEGPTDHTPEFMLKLTLEQDYARLDHLIRGLGYEPGDTSLNWGWGCGLEIEFSHVVNDFSR